MSGGWYIQWVNETTFKVEQEGCSLVDDVMEGFESWMEEQLERKFGASRIPKLTASALNFSRNKIGDNGVRALVDYLRKRDIGVQLVKFFKNMIGDAGAWAIGQLLAHSPDPVQEVHLSHNRISEQGACSILEAVARCKRYPFSSERANRRDARGLAPVWLRMEYNCINWSAIQSRLEQQKIRWCAAESREGWTPKDAAPMVCIHNSYKNQKVGGPPADLWSSGSSGGRGGGAREHILGALQHQAKPVPAAPAAPAGGEEDVSAGGAAAGGAAESEDVPMYVFLDATAVHEMTSRKEGLFTFQGILDLCSQGHVKCTWPEDYVAAPIWLGHVGEGDRIVFVVTDCVLDELNDIAERNPGQRNRVEWLRSALDSPLQKCHWWGVLEKFETSLHTQLMKLTPTQEQRAKDAKISARVLKTFDFACFWESQIDVAGRVLFLTADEDLCRFGQEVATMAGSSGRSVPVVHVGDAEQRFAADKSHGGFRLCEAALWGPRASKYCGAVLSAQLMSTLLGVSSGASGAPQKDVDSLRQELQEAVSLVLTAHQLLSSPAGSGGARGGAEVARCVERIDEAHRRWQVLVSTG